MSESTLPAATSAYDKWEGDHEAEINSYSFCEQDCFEAGFNAAVAEVAKWLATRDDFGSGSDEDYLWWQTMPSYLKD